MRKNKLPALKEKDSPLKKAALENSQAAIDAGLTFDPVKIMEEGPEAAPSSFKGISSAYPSLSGDYYDKFESYIDANTLKGRQFSLDDLTSLRAQNQSNWEQAGNAIARVATNIIPQTVSGFASMLDIPGYFSAEEAANNSIVNWAIDAKKTVDEDWFPIYEEAPGQSMQLGDFAWWMSRGSGLAESVGSFLLQGAGMGKLVSSGLKGLGAVSGGKKLATAVLGAEKSQRAYSGSAGLLNAVALNQSEAVLEATQVFRDTYEEQLQKNGGNIKAAKEAASIAAATTMSINRANILLNLSSASAFITPLKASRQLLKAPGGIRSALGRVGIEAGQEGVEELINLAASKAGMAKGRGEEYSFEKALEDIKTMEGLEAAFLGAVGGALQTGGTSALKASKYGPGSMKDEQGNRISNVQYERNRYEQQQEVLEELKQKGVKTADVLQDFKDQILFQEKLRAANEKGDVAEMERLKEQLFENQAIKAFRSGTTEVLENLYNAEASRPVEEVGEEYIARAKQAIKSLKELEAVYNNFEGYQNTEEIFFNRANKLRAEKTAAFIESQKKETDFQFSKDLQELAKQFTFENEREVLFKEEGKVVRTEKKKQESPLIYSTADIENNTGDTEQNKKTYEKFLAEVKKLPSYEAAKGYGEQMETIQNVLRNNTKEFQELTSKEYQAKAKAQKEEAQALEKARQDLKTAKDISSVERLKNNITNKEFQKEADAKIEEIKLRNDKTAKEKELAVILSDYDKRIKNTTEEADFDKLREEINTAKLSEADRKTLLNKVNIQAAKVNGEDVSAEEESESNPLEAFSQGEEELKKEVKSETESFETTLPTDLPNPSTEKSSVEEGVAQSAKELIKSDTTTVSGQDENGNLIYDFNRSEEGHNRAAFLSREFNQKEEVGVVSREEVSNSLDNLNLLDPDFLTQGTELEMEVDTDYAGQKYNPESNTRETIDWKIREAALRAEAAKKGIPVEQLDEYIAEVPIKVSTADGQQVFYVHDNAWYTSENLSASEEDIAIDKAKNFAIRKAIVSKGKVKSEVTYKSFGKLFKTFDGKSLSVSEAMPDSNLVLGIGKNGGFSLAGDTSDLLGKNSTILGKDSQPGRLYAIVKVGPNEFLPIPLQRTKLAEAHAKAIVLAVEGYLSQDKNNPIVKAIAESSLGVDITDLTGLRKYISQFIYLFPTVKNEGLESVLIRGGQDGSKLKSDMALFAVTASGIEFGRPSVPMGSYKNKQGETITQIAGTISANFNKTTDGKLRNAQMLIKLEQLLKKAMSNADLNQLAENGNAVIILNKEGETSSVKYTEFLKQTHETNILSVNTGTEEDPKWAYTIQPTILFDTSFADFSDITPATVVKKQPTISSVSSETKPSTSSSSTTSVSKIDEAKKADIERRREEAEVSISKIEDNLWNANYPINLERTIFDTLEGETKKEIQNKINAKYNEELAALEGTASTVISELTDVEYNNFVNNGIVSVDRINAIAEKIKNNKPLTTKETAIFNDKTSEINSKLEELAALEESTATTVEEEVAAAAEPVDTITSNAEQLLSAGITLEQLNSILDLFNSKQIALDSLKKAGFETYEEAEASYKKAAELLTEALKTAKTFTLPGGKKIIVHKYSKDSKELGEDIADIDDMIAPLEEGEISEIREEIDELIIRGLDPSTQMSVIYFIAGDIIKQTLEAKNKGGKQTIKTGPIFAKHKETFTKLAGFYEEMGLPNKAKRVRAIVEQFSKVNSLTNQYMSKLTVGTVNENVDMTDSEEALGLEKIVYSDDWAFTISSKNTASADLKKFFTSIQERDEDGNPIDNILGLPEMMPFDVVYDTLHEILANRPADYDHMIQIMELYSDRFTWMKSVVEQLEAAPEKIQNEFVSDMAKHSIDMQFIMWSKDRNGNYSLQRWSSNASAIEQRLRLIWNSNLKGAGTKSNLITVNDEAEYVFEQTAVDAILATAEEFKKNPSKVTNDELASWLGQFGIVITDTTYEDLRKGRYSNRGKKTWNGLFKDDAGIVAVLAKELKAKRDLTLENAELLNDSAVKALAKLDAANSVNTFSNSFRAGEKTIYSYGNNNYLVNRMRDLTAYDSETGEFVNSTLIKELQSISFSKDSLWLNDLTNEDRIGELTRSTLNLSYLSLEALKKKFTLSQDNRKLNNLTAAEHEVVKLGFFQNQSGEVLKTERRRLVHFFYPTMSDKTTMLAVKAVARQFKLADGEVSKENFNLLYDAIVVPEINRMRDKQATDIAGYEPNYFYFLPSLNTLEITLDGDTKTFREIVLDKDEKLYDPRVKEAVLEKIEETFNNLITKKLEDWKKLGIGEAVKDDKGNIIEAFPFMDKTYMKEVAKTGKGITKVQFAAMDYVFNYMIANAEAFKLFAGDPALYAKFKKDNTLQQNLEETFVNIGKRLAGDIAPGMELANSTNNKYYQVFLEDQKIDSNNTKDSVQKEFFDKIIKDYSKNYSGIEGSDAQEYTTWKEHLYVLKQLGRLTDAQYNSFKTKLEAQSKGIFNDTTELSFEELGLVMQPIKPVYVGNSASVSDNVDRRVYIKSSSFPLLPELTAGLQIDKIRQALETFETSVSKEAYGGNSPFVRASFGTANKVGAIKNTIKVFNPDGTVVNNLSITADNTLLLSRANFRIQQDVPYKRDKSEVNRGTQETKLLFADLLDVEIENGLTGAQLMESYNNNYEELFQYAQEKLARRLGLIKTVTKETRFEELLSIPDSDIFNKAETVDEAMGKASPINKIKLQEEFAEEIGEDTLERVNFINKNFNEIVNQLAKAKMNFFFDEESNTNKKC
jgi:hypothetical protein